LARAVYEFDRGNFPLPPLNVFKRQDFYCIDVSPINDFDGLEAGTQIDVC